MGQNRKNRLDVEVIPFKLMSKRQRLELDQHELEAYYKKLRKYYADFPGQKVYDFLGGVFFVGFKQVLKLIYAVRTNTSVIDKRQQSIEGKGIIIVANHVTGNDIPFIASKLKGYRWRALVKKEIISGPYGLLYTMARSIYVDRSDEKSRRQATMAMSKTLVKGGNILIFPEGTVNKTDDTLLPFKMGAVYLSQSLDKYILPVAITIDKHNHRNRTVEVLAPFKVGPHEDLIEANERLEETIRRSVLNNRNN